jgi:hypothetical protein
MKKYSYFRHKDKWAFGLNRKESRYVMVRNNEIKRWFAVLAGESVKEKDRECYYHYSNPMSGVRNDESMSKISNNYEAYINEGSWVEYKKKPKQILP